jgi:hypothetical protein
MVSAEGTREGLQDVKNLYKFRQQSMYVKPTVVCSLCYLVRAFLMIGSSDNDPFDKRRHLWRPILPNRQLAKVCSFDQTAVDESSENLRKSDGWGNVLLHKNA